MALSFKQQPRLLNLNRSPSRPKKQKKISIIFDENKRREFITGFHKRKLERREKAKQEIEREFKAEKKRIKENIRKKCKNFVSQRDIPELEELLLKNEYEVDGKSVSILELNINDLSQGSSWLGENKPVYEENNAVDVDDAEKDEYEEVPGMELTAKQKHACHEMDESEDSKLIMTKKGMSKEARKQTIASKVFKRKQLFESIRNKKKIKHKDKIKQRLLKNSKKKCSKIANKKNL